MFAVMLGLATLGFFLSCKKDEIVSPLPKEELVSFKVVHVSSRIIQEENQPERLQFIFRAFVEPKVDIMIPHALNEGGMLELVSEEGELPENWYRDLQIDTDDESELFLINAGEKAELVYRIFVLPSEKSYNLYARIRGFQYFLTDEDKTLKGMSFDREDKQYRSEVIRY